MTETEVPILKDFSLSSGDTLLLAIFLAALIHIAILLGIGFDIPKESHKISKTVEISFLQKPDKTIPKQAKTLAAEHQLGGGNALLKQSRVDESREGAERNTENVTEIVQEKTATPKKTEQKKMMTQAVAPVKVQTPTPVTETEETPEPADTEAEEAKPKLSADELQQQIAQLGQRIRDSQQSSENSKIKFVSAVSAHKFLAAQYVKDWEEKVERTGNLNYPEAARKIGESQILTMDVGINADGSIYSMRIVKSSGNPALDDAAKRIVKMSAPFAELPAELQKEVNVLVITRVWKFSDETGVTTH